jgi:hypothetical protein
MPNAKSLSLVCATALLLSVAAPAGADRNSQSEAQSRYERDRAACTNGETSQDRSTCLREAGAALQEAQRNRLDDAGGQFDRNRVTRCDSLPAGDHEDCLRRMRGEGVISGSVESGGIYRELRTTVPVE